MMKRTFLVVYVVNESAWHYRMHYFSGSYLLTFVTVSKRHVRNAMLTKTLFVTQIKCLILSLAKEVMFLAALICVFVCLWTTLLKTL